MRIAALIAAFGFALATTTQAQVEGSHEYLSGQYVIDAGANPRWQEHAVALLEKAAGEDLAIADQERNTLLVTDQGTIDGEAEVDDAKVAENVCARLQRQRRAEIAQARATGGRISPVIHCDGNSVMQISRTPNDPNFSLQPGFSLANNNDIDAPEAWDRHTGSSSTIVAVIDTGIDYNHPDLAPNMWTNPGEIAGNGRDDDANGFIDDVYGINAITGSGNPMDDQGHGTHVAGTIGAVGNNGRGVAGVNWAIKMIGVKFLNAQGSGSLFDAVRGINYLNALKDRGVNIVLSNNSWGGGGYAQVLADAIQRAESRGILFVAAAGNNSNNNDANPSYPADYNYSNVITVGALDPNTGALAGFSNYGAVNVDIAAPGTQIASTYLNGGYVYMSGTSMACPHVAGILALMKSYGPSLTPAQLKTILFNTSKPLSGLAGKVATSALASVGNALAEIQRIGAANPGGGGGATPTPGPTATPTRTPTPVPTVTPTPTPTIPPGNYAVTGTVVANGAAVGGVELTLQIGTTTITKTSGSDGRFSFGYVAGPANYTVTARKSAHSFISVSGQIRGDTVVSVSGTAQDFILSGTVRNSAGAPIPGVVVSDPRLGSRTTDATGRFQFVVPYERSYALSASHPNYEFRQDELFGVIYGAVDRVFVGTAPP